MTRNLDTGACSRRHDAQWLLHPIRTILNIRKGASVRMYLKQLAITIEPMGGFVCRGGHLN
jgi:hypothetical protein